MLNFDMTAKLTEPQIITSGDAPSLSLGREVSEVAGATGQALPLGSFGRFSGSDHIPFAEVGVPAVTFYSGSDANIHTAQDNIDNVRVEDIAVMLDAGVAALRSLLEAG
jgi:Zn-dependent M28 family amino/carboxypeptidase